MTIIQPDGSQGLLAKGIFGESVLKELGDEKMMVEVEIAITSGDQVSYQKFESWEGISLMRSLELDFCTF